MAEKHKTWEESIENWKASPDGQRELAEEQRARLIRDHLEDWISELEAITVEWFDSDSLEFKEHIFVGYPEFADQVIVVCGREIANKVCQFLFTMHNSTAFHLRRKKIVIDLTGEI